MSAVTLSKSSSVELRCSPHTTYYTNFFVLKVAVSINEQKAEIVCSENGDITLNCRYPSTKCMKITFDTISQVEAVLKKHGVSHVSNYWLGEVPFFQVGFSSEHSLKTFLCSQQREMQREISLLLSAKLKDKQPSTTGTVPVHHGFPVEVETELFLVLPDTEDKVRAVSPENCDSCLILWKESEKFDFGALFRTYQKGSACGNEELSVDVLISELRDVSDWFHLGIFLKVPHHVLRKTEMDYDKSDRRKTEMLDWWVKNEEQPMWSTIVNALFGIGMGGPAKRIAVKYNVILPTNSELRALEALPLRLQGKDSQSIDSLRGEVERLRIENGKKSDQLEEISEKLKQERKEKIKAKESLDDQREALERAHQRMSRLSVKRKEAEMMLRLKEKELFFLQQVMDKSNTDLKNTIDSKEIEIAQLKKQLGEVSSEFSLAREEAQKQREKIQQTTAELEKQSVNVRELEKTRADLDRERSRVDMMLKQLCGVNQNEKAAPIKLGTLKRAVTLKKEEVGKLLNQLNTKEAEKQKLLLLAKQHSQHEEELEDQLVQLTSEVTRMRASLVDAEDGRAKAEMKLEDLKSQMNVVSRIACSTIPEEEEVSENETMNFIALYNYNAERIEDLSFSKDDELLILNKDAEAWWLALSLKTGKEGYIPVNYIAPVKNTQTQEWFFGNISRVNAEKTLLQAGNPTGTFLVRGTEEKYSLSIRDGDVAKHYHIRKMDHGGYYIAPLCVFNTLNDLVLYHTHHTNGGGLCCKLTTVCPKVAEPTTVCNIANKWAIECSSINLKMRIGAGQYAELWEGTWNEATPVTVKCFQEDPIAVKHFFTEAAVLERLQHTRLVQLFAVCTTGGVMRIVTELMKRGSLLDYLQKGEGRSLRLPELINIANQVTSGMAYLERKHCVHCDLAARSILVGEDREVKIANFSLAKFTKNNEYTAADGEKFVTKWTAPEAALFNRFSVKSDVWSFGIFLTELITHGHEPYPDMTEEEVLARVKKGYRMPSPPGCPVTLYQIMLDCWKMYSKERPSFVHLGEALCVKTTKIGWNSSIYNHC